MSCLALKILRSSTYITKALESDKITASFFFLPPVISRFYIMSMTLQSLVVNSPNVLPYSDFTRVKEWRRYEFAQHSRNFRALKLCCVPWYIRLRMRFWPMDCLMKFFWLLVNPSLLILLRPSCFCIDSKRVPEKLLNESMLLRPSPWFLSLLALNIFGMSMKLNVPFDMGVGLAGEDV